MQVIYQAEHLIDAHLVRGRLESEGIDAHVRGEWLTGALGELPVQGLLAVCVSDEDVPVALALLADWQEEARKDSGPDAQADKGADDDVDLDPGPDAAFLA